MFKLLTGSRRRRADRTFFVFIARAGSRRRKMWRNKKFPSKQCIIYDV